MKKPDEEKEIKLMMDNLQVKYKTISTNSEITEKIKFLCSILKITINEPLNLKITDTYYDSSYFDLYGKDISFRKRECIDENEYTLKLPISEENEKIKRKEFPFPYSEKNKEKIFKDIICTFFEKEKFKNTIQEVVTIHNERLKFILEYDNTPFQLCFDKYFFYSDSHYSDTHHQIEFEFINEPKLSNDVLSLIDTLIKYVRIFFDFSSDSISKYKQAISWLKKKYTTPDHLTVVMLDIVKYSLKDDRTQQKIIKHLNQEVKEILNNLYQFQSINKNENKELVYIPTGDGMIIVLYDIPAQIPTFCRQIQEKIREYNLLLGNKKYEYEIRIGVNYGPVFTYSDIKDNVNFAGNGINMVQRITNLGGKFHILFSKEAYEALPETHRSNFEQQTNGPYAVKHGKSVEIFSLFSQELSFGNPNPIKKD
jgi:class 3 adenylate cyclase